MGLTPTARPPCACRCAVCRSAMALAQARTSSATSCSYRQQTLPSRAVGLAVPLRERGAPLCARLRRGAAHVTRVSGNGTSVNPPRESLQIEEAEKRWKTQLIEGRVKNVTPKEAGETS
jgi:hypothetical protein